MKRTVTLFLLIAFPAVFFALSPAAAGDDGQCVKALKDLKAD
jgi:hypothetical protein